MNLRLLTFLMGVAVAGMSGQTGFFGPVTARLMAGDAAPALTFTKVLSGTGAPNLTGRTAVLAFFPDTSHNLQPVSRWNELVDQFSGKPVEFVWLTAEKETTLTPWIAQNPVKGWVLLDADGGTGRSYGMELPCAVIVGPDGRIIGFDGLMVPAAETVTAALEGRIVTTMPKRDIAELMAFAKERKVLLSPEPKRMPRPEEDKPDFAPSYVVHISPAKDEDSLNASGPDYLDLKSFTLKALIQELYDVTAIRVQLPAPLDDGKRYEVAMVLPEREDKHQMYARFRQGIEEYFHFTARREKRLLDAYVVTAPDGKPPAVKAPPPDDGTQVFSSRSQVSSLEFTGRPDLKPSDIGGIRGIAMDGTTEQFCRLLEDGLDRPVVDETNLQGEFEFNIQASSQRNNDFLDRLHSQLGLSIVPAQRTVEVLVIEPHN